MAFTKIVGAGIHTLSNVHTHNINSSGIITATQFVGIFTGTNGNFSGNLDVGGNVSIGGSLTVNGDFTTLNTTLREVEILNVDANSSESAGIITQRGSGDILNLFDTNTEVFTVKDGGKVGIGTATPIGDFTILTDGMGYFGIDGGGGKGAEINVYHKDTKANTFKLANNGGSNELAQYALISGAGKHIWHIGGTTNEKMRLTTTGLGIGTDNPVTKLHLDGGNITIRNGTAAGVILDEETGVGGSLKVTTAGGTASFGPGNTSYCHIMTDRGAFYFGKQVVVDQGIIGSYDEDLQLHSPINTRRVTINKDTGNVGIGTDNPSRELTLYSPDSGSTYLNLTNATTGGGNNVGFALGLGGDEVGRIWQYGASQMEFGTNATQHMTLASTGQLGIGTDYDTSATAKKLTLILDSVEDGIWIANKESLYPAASTGYSDIRFTFRDYLTGGFTNGGEAIVRGYNESAYATQRRTALIFMTSSSATSGNATGDATEKFRITSYGSLEHKAYGGNNKLITQRTDAASSNNDIFFQLLAKNTGGVELGSLSFQRESAADDAYFAVKTRNTGGSLGERLRIDSTGKLLIGHSSPTSVGVGAAYNMPLQVIGNSYDTTGIVAARYAADANGPTMHFVKSRNATKGSQTIVQVNDTLGFIRWYGSDGTDTTNAAAMIGGYCDATPASDKIPGRLSFWTTDTLTYPIERLRINSNGTVHTNMTGTAPTWLGNTMACREKFSVFQGANFGEACFNIDVDNSNTYLSHNMYYDGGWKIKKSGSPVRNLEIGTDGWKFYTGADGSDNTGSALTERFRISPTGRILQGNNNENIDMDSSSSGQLTLDGNGYTFGIAMGSNHTALYHNSSSRDLVLGTNETERFRVGVGFGQLSDNTAAYYKPNLYIKNTSHSGYGGAITFTGEDGSGNEYTQGRIRTFGGSGSGDGSIAIEAGDLSECARFKSGYMSIGGRTPLIYGTKGLEISGGATTEIRLKNNNGGNGQADGLAIQKWTSDVSYIYDYDNSDLVFGVSNQSKLKLFKQGRLTLAPSGNTNGGNSGYSLSIVQDGNYSTLGSATGTYPGIHIKSTSTGGGSGAAIFTPDNNWGIYTNSGQTGLAIAPSTSGASSDKVRLYVMQNGQVALGANTYVRIDQAHYNDAQLTVAGGGINIVPITSGTSSPQVRHTVSWYHAGPNSSYSYQHLVTDVWGGANPTGNTEYIMGGFTIKGYRYSPAGCSNEDIFFHNWGGSMHGYSRSHRGTWDPGNAAYIHSTGYVALRLLTGTYYVYDIDLYQFAVYTARDFNVTTVTYSNNTTE